MGVLTLVTTSEGHLGVFFKAVFIEFFWYTLVK